jgi:hypothetical protein
MPTRREPGGLRAGRGGEGGTAAVEFALVLPLLLVIALALVQVGLLARDRLLVEAAARAGPPAPAATLDRAAMTVQVARTGSQGDPVTVTVGYASAVRVPLLVWLFGSTVSMDAAATDRQEFP